jgi:7-cyano-7-deazaguanine synthase
MKKAIVLCSGGIDSVTMAYYVKINLKYSRIKILFFDYGQRSLKKEEILSRRCSDNLNADFIKIKLKWLGNISGSLINKYEKLKKYRCLSNTKKEGGKFYVPCRNTIFLTYALALAESEYIKNKSINDIFIGFKCEGKESYPDTTKGFVKEINKISKISCNYPFIINAPLINKDKEDIIILGNKLGVYYKDTYSCYVSDKRHCGICLACRLRKAGFYWSGIKDPTKYNEE